jgi:hypothetical protein
LLTRDEGLYLKAAGAFAELATQISLTGSTSGYQFWMVEYLISASSSAISSTTAACS